MIRRGLCRGLIAVFLAAVPGPEACSVLAATVSPVPSQTGIPLLGTAAGAMPADARQPDSLPSLNAPILDELPAVEADRRSVSEAESAAFAAQPPAHAASPLLNPSDPRSQEEAPTAALLADPASVALTPAQMDSLPADGLRGAAGTQMDRLLHPKAPAPAPEEQGWFEPSHIVGGLLPSSHLPGGDEGRLEPLFAPIPAGTEFAPKAAPVPALHRGLLRGPFSWLAERLRVSSDKARNRAFWLFMLTQALGTLGIDFHYTAMGPLIAREGKDSSRISQNRIMTWSSHAVSTLTTGPLVDRSALSPLLMWTNLGRSILLFSVPVLFIYGYYSFAAFQLIIFGVGFLQSTNSTAASVAFARILGNDKAGYDKANAIYNLVIDAVGVFGPLVAGSFIGYMGLHLGRELIGNALAYGVYGLLTLAMAVIFGKLLLIPREELLQVRRDLLKSFKKGPGRNPRVRNVASALEGDHSILVVEVTGDPKDISGIPSEYKGYPVKVAAAVGPVAEIIQGFRENWKNRFLRLTLFLGTLETMAGDALVFSTLPRYIKEVLGTVHIGPGLRSVPALGPFLEGLSTPEGVFGLFLAASSLGMVIPALVIAMRRKEDSKAPEPPPAPGKLDSMERKARSTSVLFGAGSLAYAGVFGAGLLAIYAGMSSAVALGISVGLMLLSALLQAPAQVIWGSVHQRVMQENFPNSMGKIFSARSFYYVVCEILGLLLLGGLTAALPVSVGLWIAVGMLTVVAAIHAIEPFLVFPLDRK